VALDFNWLLGVVLSRQKAAYIEWICFRLKQKFSSQRALLRGIKGKKKKCADA
jgi:hypothetical protein